jgi:hypothetical protein
MQFRLPTLITIYGKLNRKDGVLLALHASEASSQSSASHLLTFLVAQLQFLVAQFQFLVAQLQFLLRMQTFRLSTVRAFRT